MKNLIERHQYILKKLQEEGSVSVQELSTEIQVSHVTIRKDLKLLEDKNLLFRTHGGGSSSNPYAQEKPVAEKELLHAEAKKLIAVAAVKLIGNNDSIIIASGTTMLALARSIGLDQHLTVITSALNVALALSHHQYVDVLQLGGMLRKNSSSVAGHYAEPVLSEVMCSLLFLGVDGIDLELGLTTTSLAEARLNQKMMEAAELTVILADSSKIGKRGLGKICSLDRVQYLITDDGISQSATEVLENKGIKVTVVKRF